ncbi:unnamed protein product, partial [Ectocarpus sp. 4 AP-2014]
MNTKKERPVDPDSIYRFRNQGDLAHHCHRLYTSFRLLHCDACVQYRGKRWLSMQRCERLVSASQRGDMHIFINCDRAAFGLAFERLARRPNETSTMNVNTLKTVSPARKNNATQIAFTFD